MAKISNLIAYPTVAPQLGDYVIGTDTSNSNETVNFTLQSIANIIPADTLADALAAGNTATNDINLTGNITLIGNLSTSGTIADSSGDVGTSGQVLSSTGTGTNWVDNVDGSGTLNTLAKWTPDGNTLGDSSITDDGTSVIVANDIYLQGSTIHIGNAVTDSAIVNGTMTFQQNARFNSTVQDTGGNAGGNGQILSSTVTGVSWVDQLPSGLNFQGSWNAATNTPALASGVGVQGYYYIVGTPGTTNLDGNNSWQTGDWAIFNGTVWQEIDNQNIFSGSGTTNTLTKWTGTQSLGNSSITDDGTSVIVANDTYLQGSTIQIGNASTDSAVVNAVSTFQANARFNSTMQDAGGQPGTSGQVLSSTGTSVLWKNVVDGSGTANKIPKWLDSDTLTDSGISDVAGAISISGSSLASTLNGNIQFISNTGFFTVSSNQDANIDAATEINLNRNNLTSDIGVWGPAIFENSAYFKSTIKDGTNAVGTAGQILSSTGTGVQWINNSSSSSLPLADGTRMVQVSVTSAQILNMNSVPVVLLASPGVNKILCVDSLLVKYNRVTSDYSNLVLPSVDYQVASSGITFASASNALQNMMSVGASTWYKYTKTQTQLLEDAQIVLTAFQNPTGGDSTMLFNIKYRIFNSSDLTVDLT